MLTAVLLGNSTFAQPPALNQVYSLDLKTAQLLADSAKEACKKLNQNIAVVVVDRGGNPLTAERHELVGPHNLIAAEKKAYTALSTKTSTLVLSQSSNQNPDAKNLTTLANLLLLGGGLPVHFENQVIGAIGVAGAGGAQNDNQCASKAIKTIFHS
ncbi:GlcG/HbpS family heme-binding protein [Acinetobacter calcoaceticus]|uniref:GlcG/HbpS family heme-binding protein n=1 Tax=Acinetobacter calcoaceticus TaxID=471 RepID=UPI0024910F89|nr:heme-binding protein [Acinetobacter calcoaceticus]